jgi:His-Xaa-Ser system protein HxsD
MKIKVDKNIYSDSVISKAVYWLSSKCLIKREYGQGDEVVEFCIPEKDETDVETEFYKLLNDYKLREIISLETKEIKTILYAKAFADDEDFDENNITD